VRESPCSRWRRQISSREVAWLRPCNLKLSTAVGKKTERWKDLRTEEMNGAGRDDRTIEICVRPKHSYRRLSVVSIISARPVHFLGPQVFPTVPSFCRLPLRVLNCIWPKPSNFSRRLSARRHREQEIPHESNEELGA